MTLKILSLLTSSIFLLFISGCLKEDWPIIENTTKGRKWNLRIGDTFEDVYKNLQELGVEKNFSSMSLVYRTSFSHPEAIRNLLPFYHSLTLTSSTGRVDRVIINMEDSLVSSLSAGGALPDEVDQWPPQPVEGAVIRKGDSIEEMYEALRIIHKTSQYQDYQFLLSDKPLDLAFDPDMRNYNEWAYSFFQAKKNVGKNGRSQVRLFFNKGRLERINHVYEEFDVVH